MPLGQVFEKHDGADQLPWYTFQMGGGGELDSMAMTRKRELGKKYG